MLKRITNLIFIAILVTGLMTNLAGVLPAFAQLETNDWAQPVNLSLSGSADNPVLLDTGDGNAFVVWQDAYAGSFYSRFDGSAWSQPQLGYFPFTGAVPQLAALAGGTVVALWIGPDGELMVSRAQASQFGERISWEVPRTLATQAVAFVFTVDQAGMLHLAYLRSDDSADEPAGIYYRRSRDLGTTWSVNRLIQSSLYFRGLEEDEAHLALASGKEKGSSELLLTWDNRPRRRVYLSASHDGGSNWEAPQELAQVENAGSAGSPFNMRAAFFGDQMLLLWQRGNPHGQCTYFYQVSSDDGASWSAPQQMLPGITTCSPGVMNFFRRDDALIWQLSVAREVYLLAWDGMQWSLPQLQQTLTSFQDATTAAAVDLDCWSFAYQESPARLLVAACDASHDLDIWYTQRSLADIGSWFPERALWSAPEVVDAFEGQGGPLVLAPAAIAGQVSLHALWRQPLETGTAGLEYRLRYAQLAGGHWSAAITTAPLPATSDMALAAVDDGRGDIWAAWDGDRQGGIWFTRAPAATANDPAEWLQPVAVSGVPAGARAPALAREGPGGVILAYVLPFNDGRGVYITRWDEAASAWQAPVQVFDAAAAGWDLVGDVALVHGAGESLVASWTRRSLTGSRQPDGLYRSLSQDGGESWSPAEEVASGLVNVNVLGTPSGGRAVHTWGVVDDRGRTFASQVLPSGSSQWLPDVHFTTARDLELTRATVDPAGQVHLLASGVQDQVATFSYWYGGVDGWLEGEPPALSRHSQGNFSALDAAVAEDGLLGLVTMLETIDQGGMTQTTIYASTTRVELPDASQPAQPTPEPTPAEAISAFQPTATLQPSATPALATDPLSAGRLGPFSLDNPWTGLGLAAILVGGMMALFIVWRIFQVRGYKR